MILLGFTLFLPFAAALADRHGSTGTALSAAPIQANYRYLYYPDAGVYFDQDRELYFFSEDERWLQAPSLPAAFEPLTPDFIIVERPEPSPAVFHHQIVLQYDPAPNPGLPWQPLRGQPSYQYLYYPDAEVYFYPERELYFYTVERQWIKAPTLLARLELRLGDFVILEMATEYPYEYHPQIVAYYGADDSGATPLPVVAVAPPAPTYHYRYYPAKSAYYDEIRDVYFYKDHDHWIHSPAPGPQVLRGFGAFISFTLHTPRPYEKHSLILHAHRLGAVRLSAEVHNYHYYPGPAVYHDIDRGIYHYRSDNRWHSAVTLPSSIAAHIGRGIQLKLSSKRPYLFDRQIVRAHTGFTEYSLDRKTKIKIKSDTKHKRNSKIQIEEKFNSKSKTKTKHKNYSEGKSKAKVKIKEHIKSKDKAKARSEIRDKSKSLPKLKDRAKPQIQGKTRSSDKDKRKSAAKAQKPRIKNAAAGSRISIQKNSKNRNKSKDKKHFSKRQK